MTEIEKDFFAPQPKPAGTVPETGAAEVGPIGTTHSGKPIYEVLGEGTSPEGEKFVEIRTAVPDRTETGEPDFRTTVVGEMHVPVDDIPDRLLPHHEELEEAGQEVKEDVATQAETQPADPDHLEATEEETPEEPIPESLRNAREKLSKAETNLSDQEQRLEALKENARSAIDNNDFNKAANISQEAARLKLKVNGAKGRVRGLRRTEAMFADLLNPEAIKEIEAQVLKELSAEKARRVRMQDQEPMDSYGEMLKRSHISKYLEAASQKYPKVPAAEIAKGISALIDEKKQQQPSYVYHGDKTAGAMIKEEEASPTPEPTEPQPISGNGGQEEIPEEERLFQPEQSVQIMYEGEMLPGCVVTGYRGRNAHGEPLVLIHTFMGGDEISVAQPLLENWQKAPPDTSDKWQHPDHEEPPKRAPSGGVKLPGSTGSDEADSELFANVPQRDEGSGEVLPIERGLKLWNESEKQAYEVVEVKDNPNGARVAVLEAFGPGGNESGNYELSIDALEAELGTPGSRWKLSHGTAPSSSEDNEPSAPAATTEPEPHVSGAVNAYNNWLNGGEGNRESGGGFFDTLFGTVASTAEAARRWPGRQVKRLGGSALWRTIRRNERR